MNRLPNRRRRLTGENWSKEHSAAPEWNCDWDSTAQRGRTVVALSGVFGGFKESLDAGRNDQNSLFFVLKKWEGTEIKLMTSIRIRITMSGLFQHFCRFMRQTHSFYFNFILCMYEWFNQSLIVLVLIDAELVAWGKSLLIQFILDPFGSIFYILKIKLVWLIV
jgi:hypothetical protein